MENKKVNSLSKIEQESHIKLFNETVNKEKFEGIYITGNFEEPALILSMDRMPPKEGINIFKNSVDLKADGDLYVYFYINSSKKGFKVGMIDKDVDQIFLLEEILKRYELKIMLIEDGKKEWVTYNHFITTMKL
jgi:hypothetical protein